MILNNYKLGNVYKENLDNGLTVFIIPKKGFNKFYCALMSNFGSLAKNVKINENGYERILNIPAGSAHFLEHKMFEMPNGIDAVEVFASMGIDSNAYTSYDITNYLIKGSAHLEEALCYLLDFVQTPAFTDESIEKEKGIILQELYSQTDSPNYKLKKRLFNNMYSLSNIKEDILGNEDSIESMNYKTLKDIYDVFYHPSNMALIVVGDVEPNSIIQLVKNNQSNKEYKKINSEILFDIERNGVIKKYDVIEEETKVTKVAIGIKFDNLNFDSKEMEKFHNRINMFFELLFGKQSKNYQTILDNELISSSFRNSSFISKYINYYILTANTNKPDEYINFMKKVFNNIDDFDLNYEEFIVNKKNLFGNLIVAFDDFEFIGDEYLTGYLNNYDAFENFEDFQKITFDDMIKLRKDFVNYFNESKISFVVYKNR